ncbi:ABC transporter permease [Planotetraspora kaengkrachanensis]|uniref:ABC3 transporter permease C-terminal domain-containing protein n=1 Tax=Planotetraspora kaengkrachanensis TaxID=575193 RepID=A0A8J3VBD0_9ACTN|nr:ABC transporter permease [Planotetraspora kaengkrachanensis]GIG83878.1 hypothetical protein Pka01_70050 [Planotetraspora kaengkrachanensis]
MALGARRVPLLLRRASSEPLLLLTAFGSVLLATTTLVALITYAAVVTQAGVGQAMAVAPLSTTSARVSTLISAGDLQKVDAAVRSRARAAYGDMPFTVTRSIRSDSYALPGQERREQPDLTRFATYEGIEERSRLAAGSWPREGGELEVALSTSSAQNLDLAVGDAFTVVGRLSHQPVHARVAGVFDLLDPYDDRWQGDELLRRGVESGNYTTYGPLVVAPGDFQRNFATNVSASWLAVPDLRDLPRERLPAVAVSVAGLGDDLRRDCGTCATFTRLPDVLKQLDQAALVARSTMLVPVLQLLLLAAYALTLTARLLADHRRMEVALLRSRGAGAVRLGLLAGGEALLVALPAMAIAPLIAPWLLAALDAVPWIQATGVRLAPVPDAGSFAVSAAVALACAALLVLPALRGARRTYVEERSALGRADRRGLVQRAGADLALLATAALAVWQLGLYGGPVTSTASGGLGIDPLIVAGPALTLLCGGLLGLRLIPVASSIAERITARRRGLAPALGSSQVSRRPLRYAGPALLLTMAIAIGVVSLATSATWRRSQEDQARHQAGADLRVAASADSPELGGLGRSTVYTALPGVAAATPVQRETVDFAGMKATLLAMDADRLEQVMAWRADLVSAPVPRLGRDLAAARPEVAPIPLPGEPRTLSLRVRLGLTPSDAVHGEIRLRLVVVDALGTVQETAAVPVGGGGQVARFDLRALAGTSGRPSYPLAVQALLLDLPDPGGLLTVTPALEGLRTDSGAAVPLPGDLTAWTGVGGQPAAPGGFTVQVGVASGQGAAGPFRMAVTPSGPPGPALPVVVTADLAAKAGLRVGVTDSVSMGGATRLVTPVAVASALPGTGPGEPALLTDLRTLAYQDLTEGRPPRPVAEWWLSTRGGDTAAAVAELARHPEWNQTVVDREALVRRLRDDPLASGLQGALVLGFLSAAAFALLGFLVNAAVVARERGGEFALLRVIGVSRRQVFGLLAVEQSFVVVLSLAVGVGIAAVMAVLVVPHIVLTGQAAAVTPSVVLDIPWLPVVALPAAVAAALLCIVAALARRLSGQGAGRAVRIGED